MKPLYIFDLDGTLADIKHRRHFVENGANDWDAFFQACKDDVPKRDVIQTMLTLRLGGADVYIFSGRSDSVRDLTEEWLGRYVDRMRTIPLRMRKAGDYTPDDKLKEQWYWELSETDRARLVGVFDDRDRVVAMWRKLGVLCMQVAPGDF